ncbi:uncharacterized protein si:dkey-56d12.4 [Tachysurus ichikawai]
MKISTDEVETPRSPDFLASPSARTSAEQPQRNSHNLKSRVQTLALKKKRTCDADETLILSTEESNATDLEEDQCVEHSYMANVHSIQTIPLCTNSSCQATVRTSSDECASLKAEITRLKEKVDSFSFRQESFRDNDEMVQELTD